MSSAGLESWDPTVRSQILLRAEIEPADGEDTSGPISWKVGVFSAPPEADTDTPHALVSALSMRRESRWFRTQYLTTLQGQRADATEDVLWQECLRRFGATLWRTGSVTIRHLAAIAEADLGELAAESVEPERFVIDFPDPDSESS